MPDKPVVVTDTTAVHEDRWLEGSAWTLVLSLSQRGLIELVVPEPVVLESARQYREALAREEGTPGKLRGLVMPSDRRAIPDLPGRGDGARRYEDFLRSRIAEVGGVVAPLPLVSAADLLERDVRGRRPFNREGKGFRDTLIWLTLLAAVELSTSRVAFLVSSNSKDFADAKGGSLHPRLTDEVDLISGVTEVVLVEKLPTLLEQSEIEEMVVSLRRPEPSALTPRESTDAQEVDHPIVEVPFNEGLAAAVQTACSRVSGAEVRSGDDDWGSGVALEPGVLPQGVEDVSIDDARPRLDTVASQIYETYEDGTALLEVSVEADVSLTGSVYRGNYRWLDDNDIEITSWNRGTDEAEVSLSRTVRLKFRGKVNSETFDSVELELDGAELA